jgi:hypothetical protein
MDRSWHYVDQRRMMCRQTRNEPTAVFTIARSAAWLAAIALSAIGCAIYLRYQVIEQSAAGIGCEAGPATWLCSIRGTAISLFTPSVFGWVALGAVLLNLVRPSTVLCAVALIAGGFGIVLYNAALSALAVALLILSLARTASEPG